MPAAGRLPGVRDPTSDRIILHVDNDCFYAACERLRDPLLAGEPVVVGMGFEPGSTGGAVATASYEAREYGVESAQPISEAIERLPPADQVGPDHEGPVGHYRPVDMEYYEELAAAIKSILHEVAATVREVSIDEAYLDCTDETTWAEARDFGAAVQTRIDDEVGLPASVGVGPNMTVAKIASDHDKPRGVVVVRPAAVAEFLHPLSIEALHGIGPKTASVLRENGIQTVGDLASADRDWVIDRFGDRGRELYQRANGSDPRPVEERGDPKSLSRESAFSEPIDDWADIEERVVHLAEAVAERARRKGATYRTIGIKVVEPPFSINTRERSLPGPIQDADIVTAVAKELLAEFSGGPVRKVGVRVSNLSFADGEQLDLASWSGETSATSRTNDPERAYGGQLSLGAFTEE